MTEQLEADLRQALSERAAAVPADALQRLRRTDYKPRAHRVRPPVAFGALAGGAAAAAAVVAIVGLGASAQNAFAGWSPSPTATSPGSTGVAQASCMKQLTARAAPGAPGIKPATPAEYKAVLTDVRGPFTVVIFAGRNGSASCISGPAFTALSGSSSAGPARIRSSNIQLSSTHFTTRDGRPYTIVEGHAGDGVNGTVLLLADGTRVKATTANGWFAAWWPGASDVSSAKLATPDGIKTQQLSTHGPGCPGSQGPCTRSGSVTARSGSITAGSGSVTARSDAVTAGSTPAASGSHPVHHRPPPSF
jgi:hypothetical protein